MSTEHDWKPFGSDDVYCTICEALITRKNDLRLITPCPGPAHE